MQKGSERIVITALRRIRKERGLKLEELAKLSGVPYKTICAYEARKRSTNKAAVLNLALLSKALDVGILDIIDDPEIVERCKGARL